jgi:hypothetical protein
MASAVAKRIASRVPTAVGKLSPARGRILSRSGQIAGIRAQAECSYKIGYFLIGWITGKAEPINCAQRLDAPQATAESSPQTSTGFGSRQNPKNH